MKPVMTPKRNIYESITENNFWINLTNVSTAALRLNPDSYRAQQLVPHLSRAPGLRLDVDGLSGRHPLIGYRGRSAGSKELIG